MLWRGSDVGVEDNETIHSPTPPTCHHHFGDILLFVVNFQNLDVTSVISKLDIFINLSNISNETIHSTHLPQHVGLVLVFFIKLDLS